MAKRYSSAKAKGRAPFVLIAIFLLVLLGAGGASRPDVAGQVVVRGAAWVILIAMLVRRDFRINRHISGPMVILLGAVALVIAQLVPLPPAIWSSLPGRDVLLLAADSMNEPQPWRPITMSPSATVNALSSLIVPAVCLLLMGWMSREADRRLTSLILATVTISALVGLVQYAGSDVRIPLINFVEGDVSGPFANRNHFALFVAIGCLLTPVWVFQDEPLRTRRLAGLGLLPLFILVILATGSRTGIGTAGVAIILGFAIVRKELVRLGRTLGTRTAFVGLIGLVATLVVVVGLSLAFGRAASLDRLRNLDAASDLRLDALPAVIEILRAAFPVGTGFGAFDPVYRIWERQELLSFAYLNHAHNDFLEIAMDGGAGGIILLVAAIAWWAMRSIKAWRDAGRHAMMARTGSAALLLVMIASTTDYPARTPMIMALVTISACWLSTRNEPTQKSKDQGGSAALT